MAVPSRIYDLSATAASNSPAGTDSIGTSLDDYLRAGFAITRGDLATKGSDIASSSTADVGAVQGFVHDITGTTTITSLGTVAAGIWKLLQFDGALTLTHNATSLILPRGVDEKTEAGSHALAYSLGSGNWAVPFFSTPTRHKLGSFTRDTSVASGTQAVTGVGFKAKVVVFLMQHAATAGASIGVDNATTVFSIINNHNGTANTWNNSGAESIFDVQSGTLDYRGHISTMDADGFTISWTRTGTTPSGTITVYYLALR